MSGGVDSSVSAALLKEQGFDVHGVHLRITAPEWPGCTSEQDERDASRVAAVLGIPFTVLDYSAQYKAKVIEEMLHEYKEGRTPNPDVVCNREIKFGLLYDWAMAQGFDYLATGHYAQTVNGKLQTATDQNKDQTYFLWTLTGEKLRHTLFPVGGYEKPKVRQLAASFQLPVATKKDSQGLCFVGQLDMKQFLKEHLRPSSGDVLDEQGTVIGQHEGAVLYTLGERHGFSVRARSPEQKPLFVVAKDLKQNTITVSENKLNEARTEVMISNCNWTNGAPEVGKEYAARVRYRQPLQPCSISTLETRNSTLVFKAAQIATPGQSLVLYDGNVCLGGGIIV